MDTSLYEQGHIPGAIGWSWKSQLCDTIRRDILSPAEFRKLTDARSSVSKRCVRSTRIAGITGTQPIITYCRIGERSSHTWFVLRFLLGYEDVRNYDGSWTEWGNLVGMPVEKGVPVGVA